MISVEFTVCQLHYFIDQAELTWWLQNDLTNLKSILLPFKAWKGFGIETVKVWIARGWLYIIWAFDTCGKTPCSCNNSWSCCILTLQLRLLKNNHFYTPTLFLTSYISVNYKSVDKYRLEPLRVHGVTGSWNYNNVLTLCLTSKRKVVAMYSFHIKR